MDATEKHENIKKLETARGLIREVDQEVYKSTVKGKTFILCLLGKALQVIESAMRVLA